jgi:hypothetical protein
MFWIKYSFVILCLLISATVTVYSNCLSVRDADLRNRSYPLKSSLVTPGGKLQWMHASNGRAEQFYDSTSGAYFYLEIVDIAYGDLTGDKMEEAAVTAIYGSYSASFFLTDTYVFGCVAGRIKLVGILKQEQIEKDSGMALQESVKNPLRIKNGVLYITHGTEGNRPSPKFMTTFRYRIRKGKFVLYKSPLRRRNY